MPAYAVGIDMIAIPRVRGAVERHDGRFLRRVYTPEEVAFCRGRVAELAARFAAKEAVMKALGTGARVHAFSATKDHDQVLSFYRRHGFQPWGAQVFR